MARRREREQARHGPVPEEVAAARMIALAAAEVASAADAEAWASHLLGTLRQQRHGLPFPDAVEVDPGLLFGEPLVSRLARFDDPAATVGETMVVGVLIDRNLGGLGKDVLLAESIEQVAGALGRDATADEATTRLDELLLGPKDRIRYTYDFGDNWEHDIVLEKVMEPEASDGRSVLLTGKGARPPGDCGGPWGYAELTNAGGLAPASFDLEPAQQRVQAAGR